MTTILIKRVDHTEYDISRFADIQTRQFQAQGVAVKALNVAGDSVPGHDEIKNTIDTAHIILVSGGNTLWAIDRWRKLRRLVLQSFIPGANNALFARRPTVRDFAQKADIRYGKPQNRSLRRSNVAFWQLEGHRR